MIDLHTTLWLYIIIYCNLFLQAYISPFWQANPRFIPTDFSNQASYKQYGFDGYVFEMNKLFAPMTNYVLQSSVSPVRS